MVLFDIMKRSLLIIGISIAVLSLTAGIIMIRELAFEGLNILFILLCFIAGPSLGLICIIVTALTLRIEKLEKKMETLIKK